jgi:hypothetical protein
MLYIVTRYSSLTAQTERLLQLKILFIQVCMHKKVEKYYSYKSKYVDIPWLNSSNRNESDWSDNHDFKICQHAINLRFQFVLNLSNEYVYNIANCNFLITNSLFQNTFFQFYRIKSSIELIHTLSLPNWAAGIQFKLIRRASLVLDTFFPPSEALWIDWSYREEEFVSLSISTLFQLNIPPQRGNGIILAGLVIKTPVY